jgi:hypothetical protein
MDKELGTEIVRTFGVRLRRMYEPDEHGLPFPVAEALERLRQVEDGTRDARAPAKEKSKRKIIAFVPQLFR